MKQASYLEARVPEGSIAIGPSIVPKSGRLWPLPHFTASLMAVLGAGFYLCA